jgi:hypothetical protein
MRHLLRSILTLLALAAPSLEAFAQPLPTMSDGYTIELYAAVPDPVNVSVAADGTLYVGRDLSGSGGTSGAAARIHRIAPGPSPVVAEFGDPGDDPDSVIAVPAGVPAFDGYAVLFGGRLSGVFAGYLAGIEPDATTQTVVPSNTTLQNPSGLDFDSAGRLWAGSFDNSRLVPIVNGSVGTAIVLPDNPVDLVVEPGTDRVFVSLENGTVAIYDATGALVDASFTTGRPTAFGPGTSGFGSDLYVVNLATGTLSRVDVNGDPTVIGTGFDDKVWGLDFGPDGRLYLSEFDNDRILVVPETGSPMAGAVALAALAMCRRRARRTHSQGRGL